jgi:hypothetical protein
VSHINLKRYGMKVIVPSENSILDFRKTTPENLELQVVMPAGSFKIAFKSLKLLDEFTGLFTGCNENIDISDITEKKRVEIVTP